MKLIYSTPNLDHFLGHISNVIAHQYEVTGLYVKDHTSENHASLLIEVPKGQDKYLCDDMLQALALNPSWWHNTSIEVRETMYSYFINMSIADYKRLRQYPLENIFINKLVKLVEPDIKAPSRVSYHIPYHSKFKFNILDDMRHLSHDYMKILSTTELGREQLNQLFRITIWFKLPMSALMDLKDDIHIVTANKYCTYNNSVHFENSDMDDNSMTLTLSDLTPDAELNTSAVKIGVTAKRIIGFIKKFFMSHQDTTVAFSVLPMSVYTDTFATLSLDQLSQFLTYDNPTLMSKSYYKHLNEVAETLIRTDNLMEFILTGRGIY